MTFYTLFNSPLQPVLLLSDGASLTGLRLVSPESEPQIGAGWQRRDDAAPFAQARQQLSAYFDGTLRRFALPLALHGTPFRQRVWAELQNIPFGETVSYGEMARRIGNPNAARAVGMANGSNALSLVVPCHRVVGAGGKLIGYNGGLSRKEALLAFESSVLQKGPHPFSFPSHQTTLFS